MANNDSCLGTVLIAFAAGALIGAGIALLYAPQSGDETRRLISEKADEFKRQARDKYDQGKDILREKREHLTAAYEAGKEGYRDAKTRSGKEQEANLS